MTDWKAILRAKLAGSRGRRLARPELSERAKAELARLEQLAAPPSQAELNAFLVEIEAILDAQDASPTLH